MVAPTIFAANWKMHHGPTAARELVQAVLARVAPREDRLLLFFPPAVSLEVVAATAAGRQDVAVGAQNMHWEAKGAFTGEVSVAMAREAGARAALVGHSERRHVFGETNEDTGRKVRSLLDGGLVAMLCVGETIEQREAGATLDIVERQLAVLDGLPAARLAQVVVAYEPVWAIGTGRTATPRDAADVHAAIRASMGGRGADPDQVRILYGGSVKPENIGALMTEPEIDGVLVGGASLNAEAWSGMVRVRVD